MFTLKSDRLNSLCFILNENNWEKAQQLFCQHAEKYQKYQDIPFVLDVSVFERHQAQGLIPFLDTLRQYGLHIVALQHKHSDWSNIAQKGNCLFLKKLPENWTNALNHHEHHNEKAQTNLSNTTETQHTSGHLTNYASLSHSAHKTLFINSPVRSGQQIYAENTDLIVLGRVSEGAELIADGHIHVYAAMHGRALAGYKGDKTARIFIQSMQAELVAIAGIYRNFEQQLPEHLYKKAVHIELIEDRLSVSAINTK